MFGISEHLSHIFSEGELDEKVVCRDFRRTTQHGVSFNVDLSE